MLSTGLMIYEYINIVSKKVIVFPLMGLGRDLHAEMVNLQYDNSFSFTFLTHYCVENMYVQILKSVFIVLHVQTTDK